MQLTANDTTMTHQVIKGLSNFPFEDVRIHVEGAKVTEVIHAWRSPIIGVDRQVARQLYHDHNIIHKSDFHLVYCCEDKSPSHITKCLDSGRKGMFTEYGNVCSLSQ